MTDIENDLPRLKPGLSAKAEKKAEKKASKKAVKATKAVKETKTAKATKATKPAKAAKATKTAKTAKVTGGQTHDLAAFVFGAAKAEKTDIANASSVTNAVLAKAAKAFNDGMSAKAVTRTITANVDPMFAKHVNSLLTTDAVADIRATFIKKVESKVNSIARKVAGLAGKGKLDKPTLEAAISDAAGAVATALGVKAPPKKVKSVKTAKAEKTSTKKSKSDKKSKANKPAKAEKASPKKSKKSKK